METNYKKKFAKDNKQIINRARTINIVMGFVVIFLFPVLVFTIVLKMHFGDYAEVKEVLINNKDIGYFTLFLFLTACMIMYFFFACDSINKWYTKRLERATKSFALKEYLDDMIIVMKSKWVIDKKTQERLREIIDSFSHLDCKKFTFNPDGIVLADIDEDPIVIRQNEYIYSITEWRYTSQDGFLFTFDMTDPAGITDKREMYLPSGKLKERILP